VPIKQKTALSNGERRYYFVAALIGMSLAILFTSLVAWMTYLVVVKYFRQETITFWVALPSAILFWFIEEMLQLTLPCRRALRRLAHWLAERWVKYLTREVSDHGGLTEERRKVPPVAPTDELKIHDPQKSGEESCADGPAVQSGTMAKPLAG